MPTQQQYEQIKTQFDRDGYAIVRELLSEREIADLNSRITRFVREHGAKALGDGNIFLEDKADPQSILRLQQLPRYEPWFETLTRQPRYIELAEMLLGESAIPQAGQMFGKPARVGKQTPPHQDGYYFKIEPQNALTIWIALQDVKPGAGGLAYLPGSHRTGLRNHEVSKIFGFSLGIEDLTEDEKSRFVCHPLQAGDAFVHHSLTIHAAGSNPTDRPRNAYGLTYYGQSARLDAESHTAHNARIREAWRQEARL